MSEGRVGFFNCYAFTLRNIRNTGKYYFKKTNKQIWNLNFNKNFKYFNKAKIKFDKDYFKKVINKYY